jgi:hypothetical protein
MVGDSWVNTSGSPVTDTNPLLASSPQIIPAGATATWAGDVWIISDRPTASGTTAPSNPIEGQQWIDTSSAPPIVKIFHKYLSPQWTSLSSLITQASDIGVQAGATRNMPKGPYSAGEDYVVGDIVSTANGDSWACIVATENNAPPATSATASNTWWTLLSSKGATGAGSNIRYIFSAATGATAPALPANNITADTTDWKLNGTATARWMSIQVNILNATTNVVTTYGNWSAAALIKGEKGDLGVGIKGDPGDSAVRVYRGTLTSTQPGKPTVNYSAITNSGTAVDTWYQMPVTVNGTTIKIQWQCDGITTAAGVTTWGDAYLSYLKVDTLAAFTTNTGALVVTDVVKVGSLTLDANKNPDSNSSGILINPSVPKISTYSAGVERIKMGNLGFTYGIKGFNSSSVETFTLDDNGLVTYPRNAVLNKFGTSYNFPCLLEGKLRQTQAIAGTITTEINIGAYSAGAFRVFAQVVGYYENATYTTSSANSAFMAGEVLFKNKGGLPAYMSTTYISTDTTDGTNFAAGSRIQLLLIDGSLTLKLLSRANQGAGANTYYRYIIWGMDDGFYPCFNNSYG